MLRSLTLNDGDSYSPVAGGTSVSSIESPSFLEKELGIAKVSFQQPDFAIAATRIPPSPGLLGEPNQLDFLSLHDQAMQGHSIVLELTQSLASKTVTSW